MVAFWSDAAVLAPLGPARPPAALIDTLLRVPAKGLTNIGFGLATGLAELGRSAARHRSAILLTDAVHNAGPDPRLVARRFPRLHVLLQTDGEHDEPLGRDLARLGHGSRSTSASAMILILSASTDSTRTGGTVSPTAGRPIGIRPPS